MLTRAVFCDILKCRGFFSCEDHKKLNCQVTSLIDRPFLDIPGEDAKEDKCMAELDNPKIQKILRSREFAHLATIGPDGAPQSTPMWFLWDGEYIKFTHTTTRQKYRNIQRDPRVAVSIIDADDPYTAAEFRGRVERIEPDPTGAFYDILAQHYEVPWRYRGDPRVILYMKIERITGQNLE